MTIQTRALVLSVLVLSAVGCELVSPTNPFDPETSPDGQAKSTLVGRVVLDDNTAPRAALLLEYNAIEVVLLGDDGRPRQAANGAPVRADVEVTSDDNDAALNFSFSELQPGSYSVRVDNVGDRYRAPLIPLVKGAPGAVVDVGDLIFTSSGGPGVIGGNARLVGGAGGARTVDLFRMVGGAPELVASQRTDVDAAFRFSGLSIGDYAVVSSLDGFTPDHRLDISVGESEGAVLQHQFAGDDALTLHPVTAVLLPTIPQAEDGFFYTRADSVPVAVLAFGGVSTMRLATDAGFLDGDGEPIDFTPYNAQATVALPAREGRIPLFSQFEARSPGGFIFASPTFESAVVRDVTPPRVVAASPPGLVRNPDGTFFVTGDAINVSLDIDATDDHSAVNGVALVRATTAPAPEDLTFITVSSVGGLTRINQPVPLDAAEGLQRIFVFVRDRAGNISPPAEVGLVVDTGAVALPLLVASAEDGQQRSRVAELAFDETDAPELPVAMHVGLAPLRSNTAVVPYEPTFTLGVDGAHGSVVSFEARLFDAAGNAALVRSDAVVLTLVANLSGRAVLEGVPSLRASHAGAQVQLLRGSTQVATTVSAANGDFAFPNVPEGDGYRLFVRADGYTASEQLLPPLLANTDISLPPVALRLARGELAGRFLFADQEANPEAHGGILVVATLGGLDRRLVLTAVTTTTGEWRVGDVPTSRIGEAWSVEGIAQGYARAAAGDFEVQEGVPTVVSPNADDPTIADPILLQPNSGDFDLCAPTGTCTPLAFTNLATLRVRLRAAAGVTQVRVRAREAFTEGDVEPAFIAFDSLNEPTVDISGDDGVVEVFVQVVVDGSPGPVLRSSLTRDTVPPDITAFAIAADTQALDPQFTRSTVVRAQLDADPGVGPVAPLANARLAFANSAPIAPPGGATLCAPGLPCDVALPKVGNVVEERRYDLFGFACDVAGNCSTAPANARVVHDRTPPSALHAVTLAATGAGLVTVGGTTFTRSPSTRTLLTVGRARNGDDVEVRDLNNAAVADVYAIRLGLDSLLQGAPVQVLEGALPPDSTRNLAAPPLPAEDGASRLFAQLIDAAGNRTSVEPNNFFYDLTLDTIAPSVAFTLANAAATTATTEVALTVNADPIDRPTRVRLATDGGLFATFVERAFPFVGQNGTFSLPAGVAPNGDGQQTVFARFFDSAGNFSDRQDSIILDRTAPLMRTVRCESCSVVNGANFSNAANRQVVIDADATDATTGVTSLRVQVGTGTIATVPFGLPFTVTLPADGQHVIRVAAVDGAGNTSTNALLPVTLDRVAPTVSVRINNNDALTRSADVFVSVVATDATSGLNTVRLSPTAAFTGAPQPFTDTLAFRLDAPGVDGSKTAFVEVRDAAGNITVASDSITLDQTPPAGTVSINTGAAFTSSRTVAVRLTFPADTTGFALAEGALDCATATFTNTTGTSANVPTFSLSPGDGSKGLTACFVDAAGNTATGTASITLDETAPTAAVLINDGAAFTTSSTVGLSLSASADATLMSIALTGPIDCATAAFEAFAASTTVSLPAGQGLKVVRVCFRDRAGNNQLVQASITVDTQAPTLSLTLNGGATHTNAGAVTVALAASADVVASALSTGPSLNCATAVFEAFQGARVIPLPAGEGSKTVRACVKDQAGNTTQSQASITVDTLAPIVTPTLAGGAARINTVATSISAAVTEDVVFAVGLGVLDCAGATYSGTFVSSVPSTPVTLAAADGTQRVVMCVRDRAGNLASADRTVELDRTAPTGTLRLNDGGTHTGSADITVRIVDASSDVTTAFVTTGALANCDGVAAGSFLAFAPTSPLTLAGGDGSKTVRVCLRDSVDNRTLLTPASIVLDRAPPTAPSALTAFDQVRNQNVANGARIRDAQPRLSFTASSDVNGGPPSHRLQLSSDVSFANPEFNVVLGTATTFTPPGELSDRTWNWRVIATDAAGNTANSAVASFIVDRTAPQAPILTTIPAFVRTSFTASWTPADADAATFDIEVFRGTPGVSVFTASTAGTTQALNTGVQLATGTQTGTAYQVRVRAVDSVGNQSAVASASFIFDDGAPCQNASGPILRLNDSGGFVSGQQLTATGATLVQVGCNGESPTGMRINCDGTSLASSPLVAFQSTFTCSLNTASQGNKQITVSVEDAAGNTRVTPTSTIFFDSVVPSTPRFSQPTNVVGTTTTQLSPLALQSTDPGGAGASGLSTTPYEVRTTASPVAIAWNGTSPLTVSLTEGDNTLRVRAVDRAGNASDEDIVAIKRDTSRPTVTNVVAEAGNGDIFVTWDTAATDVQRFEVLYGPAGSNNVADYTGTNADQGASPLNAGAARSLRLTGLPNGTPTFVAVRAFDAVGAGGITRQFNSITPNEVPLIQASATGSGDAGTTRGVAWADGIAFVVYGCDGEASCSSSGVRAWDLSDPESPTLLGSMLFTNGVFARATDIAILGDNAYIPDGTVTRVVSIADPAAMFVRQGVTVPGEVGGSGDDFALAVAVRPGQVFVAAEKEGILVYDITTDAGLLSFRDACNTVDGGCMFGATNGFATARAVSIAVQGDFAYVGNGEFNAGQRALDVVDVSNSFAPVRFGTGEISSLTAWDVEFHGRLLYLAQNGRLRVHDVSGFSFTASLSGDDAQAQSSGQPVAVTVAGPYVYLADQDGSRIKVLSSENRPFNNKEMRIVGEISAGAQSFLQVCDVGGGVLGIDDSCSQQRLFAPSARLTVAGNLLLEANKTTGFVVYRVGRPVRAKEVAHLPAATDGNFGGAANGLGLGMKGRNLINAGRTGVGLYRVDAPASVATIGALGAPPSHHVIDLANDTIFLARSNEIQQLRFSSAGGTAALSTNEGWRLQDRTTLSYGNTKHAAALHVRWPFAYVLLSTSQGQANAGTELKVLNLRANTVTATLTIPAGTGFRDGSIAYHRNRLYITRSTGPDVTIVNITNRASPSTTLGAVVQSGASGVSIQGSQLYVGGFNSTRIFDLASSLDSPPLLGSIAVGGSVLTASGDAVYSSREPRPTIVSTVDPSDMKLVAQPGRLRFEEGVLVVGKHVFLQDRDELSVLELQ